MDEAVLLLVLRLGAGGLLLLFIGALGVLLWRDFRVVSQEIESRRTPKGKLVVLAHDESPLNLYDEFPLLPLTSLGRGPTNTISLPDAFISNDHALVSYQGGHWWLEDRGSSNGTALNGALITEPVALSNGDLIGLGRITLRLELE